jgi:dTDP-4-dehydrorhamnose reductase
MILVFGKNGQISRELEKFDNVITLDRSQADLNDAETCVQVIRLYRPKAVINAAAYTNVDNAEKEKDYAMQINGITPGIIAKACAELKIPFVYISSDYVFEGSGNMPWKTSDQTNPLNVYGHTKVKGENLVIASGADYAVLRTSWVVSGHGKNFVKTMLQLSETKNSINVVSDQIGGPTFARDIALVCLDIIDQIIIDPKKSGIYHYSGNPNISWCEFANIIFELAKKETIANPILSNDYPTLAKRPLNSCLDCNKTFDVFGISRPDWQVSLKYFLEELE